APPPPAQGACADSGGAGAAAAKSIRADGAASFVDHLHAVRGRTDHAELTARDLFNAGGTGPRGLFEFQATKLHVQRVTLVLQLRQLDELNAILMTRPDDRDATRDHRQQQHTHRESADRPQGRPPGAALSAMRNTAERARGLRSTSPVSGICARPMARNGADFGGGAGSPRRTDTGCGPRMNCLTMRSSSEWKLITARRPPGFNTSTTAGRARSSEPSSSLTCNRSAWNVRVAGCLLRSRRPSVCSTSSASARVVRSGDSARRATIARAIRRLMRSSP